MATSIEHTLQQTGFKVSALILSKFRGTEIAKEYQRLNDMPRGQSMTRVGVVVGGLFALALLAASFGWVGLAIYFGSALVLFR